MQTTTIKIKGTHCNSCKFLIEDVCKDIKGAKACAVDFQTGETVIKHDEDFNLRAFKKEVESLGNYTVNLDEK